MHAAHFGFDLRPAAAAHAKNRCGIKIFLSNIALAPNRTRLCGHDAGRNRLKRMGWIFGGRTAGQRQIRCALRQRLTHQSRAWQNQATLKHFVWAERVDGGGCAESS